MRVGCCCHLLVMKDVLNLIYLDFRQEQKLDG